MDAELSQTHIGAEPRHRSQGLLTKGSHFVISITKQKKQEQSKDCVECIHKETRTRRRSRASGWKERWRGEQRTSSGSTEDVTGRQSREQGGDPDAGQWVQRGGGRPWGAGNPGDVCAREITEHLQILGRGTMRMGFQKSQGCCCVGPERGDQRWEARKQ